jgi:large repetitive protein
MNKEFAIDANGTAYIMSSAQDGNSNNRFLAIKADGTLLWSYVTYVSINSPAIGADGVLYVGCDDNKLYAFGP